MMKSNLVIGQLGEFNRACALREAAAIFVAYSAVPHSTGSHPASA